jgi:hypothetical protein
MVMPDIFFLFSDLCLNECDLQQDYNDRLKALILTDKLEWILAFCF